MTGPDAPRGLDSTSMTYVDERGGWSDGPAPTAGDTVVRRTGRTFRQVSLYYANVIGYGRILIAAVAMALILYAPSWKVAIAALLMASVLLDWIDGPVARRFGQSTVIGAGLDWLADLCAQTVLAAWCLRAGSPITAFVVVVTWIELSTGLFDFAATATGVYPRQTDTSTLPWYARVEHWLTPNQIYNRFGTACWLANTAFPLAFVLSLPAWATVALAPLAILYAWHETCQLAFLLANWREASAALKNGLDYMRDCTAAEIALLEQAYRQCRDRVPESEALSGARSGSAITWFNVYHGGAYGAAFALREPLTQWVHDLLREFYAAPRAVLSFGFIMAPRNGRESQQWHFDYAPSVSNLFIPMTVVTHRNATQFVRGALRRVGMPPSNYFPDPHELFDGEGVSHMEVSQIISKPFTILKLAPSVLHRGIANGEETDRLLFFVSTNDVAIDIGEGATNYGEAEAVAATASDA